MAKRSRLLYVDNLRVLLTALVILHHLAITYGGPGGWYYHEYDLADLDTATTVVLVELVAVNQAFFMGLFFFIAGYFTPQSYDRKGGGRFLKARLLRLGVPLLVYVIVLAPLIRYMLITLRDGRSLSLSGLIALYAQGPYGVDFGPLWFTETLLIFAFIYAAWRVAARRAPRQSEEGRLPTHRRIALYGLAVGLATFVVRIWLPVGWAFQPLNLQFPFFPQYVGMFILGIMAYRCRWLEQVSKDFVRPWLRATAALVLFLPVLLVLSGALEGDTEPVLGGLHWQALAYAVWEQLLCVAMSISLLYLFRERYNRQGVLAQALSASAYAAFILHAPVLVGLALSLKGLALPPLPKSALLAPVAVALCFLAGASIRRLRFRTTQ